LKNNKRRKSLVLFESI